MLTREAFNALLQTLEEPPEHVIFILATTDVHKLPDTIVSRCITFTFRPIEPEAVVEHLAHIAKEEGFKISKDALTLIARHGEGSFRDSISLLDQIKHISSGTIEVTDVELALGLAPEDVIEKILSAIIQGDPALLNQELSTAYEKGASESNLARQLSELLRYDLLSGKPRLGSTASIELLQRLLDVTGSVKPRATLELALLDQLFKANPVNTSTQKQEKAEAAEIEVVVKLPETKEKAEGKEIAQPVKKKPEEPATVIEHDE